MFHGYRIAGESAVTEGQAGLEKIVLRTIFEHTTATGAKPPRTENNTEILNNSLNIFYSSGLMFYNYRLC